MGEVVVAAGAAAAAAAAAEAAVVKAPQVLPRAAVRRLAGGPAGSVRWSAAVARRICARVESGESLRAICADADMPHRTTVLLWRKALPEFAARLERARRAAGWHMLGGRKPMWCESLAAEVCARLAAGERLSRVCDDPEMPSLALVYKWRAERPAFARAIELARQVQAERYFDLGWEIAERVTPADAFATHVKLTQLRWTAGALAPTRFGKFRPVVAEVTAMDEAEAAAAEALAGAAAASSGAGAGGGAREVTFYVRHFKVEERPDGTKAVVGYRRNCRTGELVRDNSDDED